jgi:hypothetical protein
MVHLPLLAFSTKDDLSMMRLPPPRVGQGISLSALLFLLLGLGACASNDEGKLYPQPRSQLGLVDPQGRKPEGFQNIKLKLMLHFPDAATDAATKQLLIIIRERPTSSAGCADLWSKNASTWREGASLIEAPFKGQSVLSPVSQGAYLMLVYTLSTVHDLLCQTDEWCETSTAGPHCAPLWGGVPICSAETADASKSIIAGGCGEGTLGPTLSQNNINITLKKAAAR